MATIHISRSGATLGTFEEEKVREGLRTGEFIGTDLGWMEGMATWRPLSELDDFRTAPPPPVHPSIPEPTAPLPEMSSTAPVVVSTPMAATGLPWENREQLGWLNALVETVQMVLLHPEQAFAAMRREGGLVDPLLYTIILGMVGAVISFVFSIGLHSFGLGSRNGLGALVGMGAVSFGWLIAMPFVLVIGAFIAAGLFHLVLMLIGGAKQPFEATLRVFCF
ncbi:MAG: YIP1 family protein, partial [Chthoniobacterales bacterium]